MNVYKLPFIGNKSGFGFIALWPYLPSRYTAPEKFSEVRDKILAFKGGFGSTAIASEFISKSYMLKQNLGELAEWTLAVIPASNQIKTESRFKAFANLLSLNLGFNNGFDLIRAEGDRAERKLQQDRDSVNILNHLNFPQSIKGKKIILFDDVLTTGKSFELIAFKLMELGAEDVFGLFLSKTVWPTEKSIDFEFDPKINKPVITQRNHKLPLKNGIFSKNGIDIEWVDIPEGSFIMGCPDSEINRFKLWNYSDPDQEPYNEQEYLVSLSGFKISKYAITFHQYDAFCELTGRQKPELRNSNPVYRFHPFPRALCPVVNVDWHDAKAFADYMDCRLPTEAEWEYACRAGTNTTFNKGNYLKTTQANFFDILNENPWKNHWPMPVGTYPPNAWGLYEMHGNVQEWCNDRPGEPDWDPDGDNLVHLTNPMGSSNGTHRVLRGGSYNQEIEHCRSASRLDSELPKFKNNHTGFRLVIL